MIAFSILVSLYFLPTIAVLLNGNANGMDKAGVCALNLIFGWTLIGWFLAVVFSLVDYKGNRRIKQAQADFYLREDAKYRASRSPR